jgi:chaperonin cofactor prefoldin
MSGASANSAAKRRRGAQAGPPVASRQPQRGPSMPRPPPQYRQTQQMKQPQYQPNQSFDNSYNAYENPFHQPQPQANIKPKPAFDATHLTPQQTFNLLFNKIHELESEINHLKETTQTSENIGDTSDFVTRNEFNDLTQQISNDIENLENKVSEVDENITKVDNKINDNKNSLMSIQSNFLTLNSTIMGMQQKNNVPLTNNSETTPSADVNAEVF